METNQEMQESTVVESTTTETNKTEKTYDENQVLTLIRKETEAALAKQKKEYEKKLSLAKLDGVERERAEAANTIADLQAKLAEYEIEKQKSEMKSVLSSRGLSAQFADLIKVSEDNTENQAAIETLDALFKECVANEVKKRLASGKPQLGTGENSGTLDFKKMTLAERQALFNADPQKYNALKGN